MRAIGLIVCLLALSVSIVCSATFAAGGARAPGLNGVIAFTSAGPSYQEIYRVEVATGRRTDLTKRRSENGALQPRDAVASPDGRTIVFRVSYSLWRMSPDGSGQRELGRGGAPAWSPDSKRIAFVDQTGFVATMAADGSDVRRLVRGSAPAWSPDGRSIAYLEGPSVMIVDAAGGDARRIYSTTAVQINSSITWSPDSTRVAFSAPEAIVAVPAAGGAPRVLAVGNADSNRHGPRWSPGGNRIAFVRAGRIYIVSETGEQLQRTRPAKASADGSPAWSPDGQSLAFLRGGGEHSYREVWVVSRTGIARRVKQEDFHARLSGLAWTADGSSLLYSHELATPDRDLYTIAPDGSGLRRLTSNDVEDYDPAFSPDGRTIAFVRELRPSPEVFNSELFVMRADGGGIRRLTRWSGEDIAPAWSPDGSRIVFLRERRDDPGWRQLYTIRPDGTHLVRLIPRAGAWGNPAWSPDGRSIAITGAFDGSLGKDGGGDLNVVGADGRNFRQLVRYDDASDYFAVNPAWLPSGNRISFTRAATDECCQELGDLWTIVSGGGRARFLVGGVHNAAWSPDGTQLVALGDGYDGRLRIVAANGKPVRPLPAARASGAVLDGFGLSWQPRCSVAGSPRGDRLRARVRRVLICGFGGPDRIAGGPGRDRLLGGEGDDTIDARGGGFDVVGCGRGRDTIQADRADYVGVDCEEVTRR